MIAVTSEGGAPAAAGSGARCASGSSSHENCSSSVQGRATRCQLSIAPVGQGDTQARHSSHLSASTT